MGEIRPVSKIITINRGRFDPKDFIGKGWGIFDEETDLQSASLIELDLSKVQFVTLLKEDENRIKGEEKFNRLKSLGYIRLDVDIFLTLWNNKHLIPENWKKKINGNTSFIYFDGTVLKDSAGRRCILYLSWSDGNWCWSVDWLTSDNYWNEYTLSAVLVKK